MVGVSTPEQAKNSAEHHAAVLRKRGAPCLVVLDIDYRIINAEPRLDVVLREAGLPERPLDRLPPAIESVVRTLTASAFNGGEPAGDAAVPVPGIMVRTSVLTGPTGLCIAASLRASSGT